VENSVRGQISVHPRGFGFLQHDGSQGSSFVPPPALAPFLAGDIVSAHCLTAPDGRTTASQLTLEARWRTELFGTVGMVRGKAHLHPDPRVANSAWRLSGAPNDLDPGDFVVARLGQKDATWLRTVPPSQATLEAVLVNWGIRTTFPAACLEAAKQVPAVLKSRRDLRSVPTLTIDAPSSRDLDDALAVLPPQADGAVRVLVCIADVDSVVKPGSALDDEARKRLTSVYLPDRVTPMLPRALSEDSLSLVEGCDRPVIAVELRIDPDGQVTSADIFEAVMRSDARLSYAAVAAFLDDDDTAAVPQIVHPTLRWLRTASARLSAARDSRGGVTTFSRDEAGLAIDPATGAPTDIQPRPQNCAHQLIERLMVATNEAVARWLVARGLPGMYRVMPEPTTDRVAELSRVAAQFGFEAGFGERISPRAMKAFEAQFETSTVAPAMRTIVRGALGPASYSTQPAAHFALAAPRYLHFTSPIRRYADLLVHRIVKAHLHGLRDQDPANPELVAVTDNLNDAAYRARKAESERRNMLVARLFQDRIGQRFEGNVIAVKSFGLVIQLLGTGVTGTIATDTLTDGPWTHDPSTQTLACDQRRYQIGQALSVCVTAADETLGRIEFKQISAR
jgi:ribonuclease R